jgi:hypothetical protein
LNQNKEFSHIEVRAIRNPEWLKVREKQGFFLSEEFPLGEFKLPGGYENMTEKDIDGLRFRLTLEITLKSLTDVPKESTVSGKKTI